MNAMKKLINRRTDDLACAFVDSMIEHAKSNWAFNVKLELSKKNS